MRKASKRGSTLVAALLLISLLLVAGLGLLSRKVVEYGRLQLDQMSAQALLLARSGLQDALLKWGKDVQFPPMAAVDQPLFSYTEDLHRSDGVTLVGRYSVTIDRTYAKSPKLAIITSVGTVGTEQAPVARRTLRVELDLDDSRAGYFRLLNYQDLGNL